MSSRKRIDLARHDLLRQVLGNVECAFVPSFPWQALIRSAREAAMLGTLAHRIGERGLLARVPPAPRAHLVAAASVCRAQEAAVRREVLEVRKALEPLDVPLVLLKGSAYLLARLPPSYGRTFSDIDVLVPRRALAHVESALMLAGFATSHHNAYDQRYYRQWMHELPPMQHVKRLTVLDVHYGIAPQTGRVHPDPDALLASAIAVPDVPGVFTLGAADMVLHSATHLFYNEELGHAFRDLADIDALLRHYANDARFWPHLLYRARQLELGRCLYYALRFVHRLLATPVPSDVLDESGRDAPGLLAGRAMDLLLTTALPPTVSLPSTRWSRRILYLRAYWLRMPLPLLAYHVTVKAFQREPDPA